MTRNTFIVATVVGVWILAATSNLCRCQSNPRAVPPTILCPVSARLPNPNDCRYYLDCAGDGTYTSTRCPEGTYYNACSGNCNITEQPNPCTVPCSANEAAYAIAAPGNAAVYFSCEANESASSITVRVCDSGTTFEEDSDSCSGPTNVCPIPDDDGGFSCPIDQGGYFADPNNCSRFYYCNGLPENNPAPNDCSPGQYFNISAAGCMQFSCSSAGFFADPVDCTRYYYCGSNLEQTSGSCPPGSHFDSSAGGCVNGNCTTICPGATNGGGGCDNPFTCNSSGFFADPCNCTNYYYCDNRGNQQHVSCPPGSHFDVSAGGCILGNCTRSMSSARAHLGLLHPQTVSR